MGTEGDIQKTKNCVEEILKKLRIVSKRYSKNQELRRRDIQKTKNCVEEIFKKLRIASKNKTPLGHPPPLSVLFCHTKNYPHNFVGKCIYNGQNKFYAWSHVKIYLVLLYMQ